VTIVVVMAMSQVQQQPNSARVLEPVVRRHAINGRSAGLQAPQISRSCTCGRAPSGEFGSLVAAELIK